LRRNSEICRPATAQQHPFFFSFSSFNLRGQTCGATALATFGGTNKPSQHDQIHQFH
jgi:hypothetical protein